MASSGPLSGVNRPIQSTRSSFSAANGYCSTSMELWTVPTQLMSPRSSLGVEIATTCTVSPSAAMMSPCSASTGPCIVTTVGVRPPRASSGPARLW